MMLRFSALLLLAAPLGGCLQTVTGSVAGSGCKFIERPPYAVQGRAQYDQDWIDGTIESAGGACHWKPPARRPPEIDAKPVRKMAVPIKKRGVFGRIKDRAKASVKTIWPAPSAAPQAPLPEPVVAAPVLPPEPPKPRSAIDELLHPSDSVRKVGR